MRSAKEKWIKSDFEKATLEDLIEMRRNMNVSLKNSKANVDAELIKALTRNLDIIRVIIARKEKIANIG